MDSAAMAARKDISNMFVADEVSGMNAHVGKSVRSELPEKALFNAFEVNEQAKE